MTDNLVKRVVRHKSSRASEFAAKYDVRKLVYYEKHKSLEDSLKREKQLKKWERQWKMRLIESRNPDWKDLFGEIIRGTKAPV
jgi:putative endonuclease